MATCWDDMRSRTGRRQRLPWAAICLVSAMAVLASLPGCGGCRQDPAEAEKEKRDKSKEKPKPDFDPPLLSTRPSQRMPDAEPDALGPFCGKPGHWTATTLKAKTNNFDFVGDLRISPTDSRGNITPLEKTQFEMSTSRQVSLPKREPKVFESVMFVPPSGRPRSARFQFNWRRGGRRAIEGSRPLTRMPSYQYHFVVLARWPGRYVHLAKLASVAPPSDSMSSAETSPYYRVALMEGVRRPPQRLLLPSHGLLWTSIAYVLWDDAEPDALSLDQQLGMLDWLHFGGQLIISGPESLDTLRGSFLAPYLPATSSGSRVLGGADFKELHAWANRSKTVDPLMPVRPLTGVTLEKHPQAAFIPGSGDLLVERRVGRGRIVVSAFRLAERDLTVWPGLDEVFNAFLLRRKPRRFSETKDLDVLANWDDANCHRLDAAYVSRLRYFARDTGVKFRNGYAEDVWRAKADIQSVSPSGTGMAAWNDSGPVAESARTALKTAAQIEIPTRNRVLGILAGYLLILVPVNWVVFRLAGRVEWAWAAAPVIAVVCTFVVIRVAALDIGFARSQSEVTVLEVQAGYPRAHASRYTVLYTSLTTEYDFHYEDPGALAMAFPIVSPKDANSASSFSDHRELVYRRGGNGATLEGYYVQSNSIGMLHSEQMIDLDGKLSLVEESGGVLQVRNGTKLTLHDTGVIEKEDPSGSTRIAWVGSLEPGKSSRLQFVSLVASSPGDPTFKQERTDPMLTGIGLPDGELDLSQLVLLAEGRAVDKNGLPRGDPLRPGEMRLVAGVKEPPAGPVVDPTPNQTRFGTLVIAHLRYADEERPRPDANTLKEFKSEI